MSESGASRFDAERYVSLATYRRDGRQVRTPVWIARADQKLYVFSEGTAGKVMRIRATRRVSLAPCSFRGEVRGDWLEGRGRVVQEAEVIERAYTALREKYGWQMRLGDLTSRLSGRYAKRAMLEIEIQAGRDS